MASKVLKKQKKLKLDGAKSIKKLKKLILDGAKSIKNKKVPRPLGYF